MNTNEGTCAHRADVLLAELAAEQEATGKRTRAALQTGAYADVCRLAGQLDLYARIARHLRDTTPTPGTGVVEYLLSEPVLARSLAACTHDEREGLHYLTGIITGGRAIPLAVATPDLESRGVAHATATPAGTHAVMSAAARQGCVILVVVHSHPGKGPVANQPSGPDLHTQALWEHTGSVLSGIWTRDRCIRFYTATQDYKIRIVGEGVEHVDGSIYRLTTHA